jgi:OFA family oxalate/formate antiporter-like MFS transporter
MLPKLRGSPRSEGEMTPVLPADAAAGARCLGLPGDQGRWWLLPLGLLLMLCLGSVYAWSIFRTPLERELGLTSAASLLPFTAVLVAYAALMPVAGYFLPRIGTRRMAAIGAVLVGSGYGLASTASGLEGLLLGYGLIAGAGIGIVYGVPILVISRWFPDRKGLAMGTILVGFGLSPLLTAPLAQRSIEAFSVRPTLQLFGLVIAALILLIAPCMRLPPQGWLPRGHGAATTAGDGPARYPSRLLASRSFHGLWLCFAIATLVGLSAIGISAPVGAEMIGISPALAAASVSLFALFNGLGRPLFGWLCDRFRPDRVALFSYGLMLLACLLMLAAGPGQVATYLVAFSLFWFCLGGWLAMAPTITLRFFDPARHAFNYGLVFTAYGAGALTGTLLIGRMRELFGSYRQGFLPLALLLVLGAVLAATWLKRERG